MARALTKSPPDGGPSFRERLRAWWEGYELDADADHMNDIDVPDVGDDVRPMRPAGTAPQRGRSAGSPWTPGRLAVAKAIWGDGQTLPGGPDYVLDMASAFSLTSADTALQIGSGLGGDAAAIVNRFGAYMTCLERDRTLHKMAKQRAVTLGIDDKVQFEALAGDRPKLRSNYFLGAVVREALCTVEDKETFLTAVIGAVKPEGQIVIVDLMFDPDQDSPVLQRWRETEPYPVYPCSIDAVTRHFSQSNVVTRTAADESENYRSLALAGWMNMLNRVSGDLDRSLAEPLLEEAELWARRIAAIDAGVLRYVHLVGVKNH